MLFLIDGGITVFIHRNTYCVTQTTSYDAIPKIPLKHPFELKIGSYVEQPLNFNFRFNQKMV